MDLNGPKESCVRWGSSGDEGRCHGNQLLRFKGIPKLTWVAWVVQASRGWSGMPGHVRQNDTGFTLLQEELNAPIFRPLQPNFAMAPYNWVNFGGSLPLNGGGQRRESHGER